MPAAATKPQAPTVSRERAESFARRWMAQAARFKRAGRAEEARAMLRRAWAWRAAARGEAAPSSPPCLKLVAIPAGDPLGGKCVRCAFFRSTNRRGWGCCSGNAAAYKEKFGRTFRAGAPEGPSFAVRRLDGCSHWEVVW